MRTLSIDIESYCETDIKTAGGYKYAETAEIILFGYSWDYGPVDVIDLTWDSLTPDLVEALTDPNVLKLAWNAAFERSVIGQYLNTYLPPEQWEDTMVRAATAGLPLSLGEASKALGLEQEKDTTGKALIRYFCVPCKESKTNGGRTRNLPEHAPEKWDSFIKYCAQDVRTEQAISKALAWLKIPELEKRVWCLDQKINEQGIKVDLKLVNNAISMDAIFRERLTKEALELTGLDNPNSVAQLKKWLEQETGEQVLSLNKETVLQMVGDVESDQARRVLEIRAAMSRSSVKKYAAMLNAAGRGDRVRGLFQYYGANRTGRFSGRLVQAQNLARISYSDDLLQMARDLCLDNDAETMEMCFGNVPDVLSQLVRTAFIPEPGHTFLVVDYSAIEARNLAWLAGEKWRLDVFNTHGKIYEASASQMFKVPIEQVTKTSVLRQKAKVAELALGYAGGPNALLKMGALDMGLEEKELQPLVNAWRNANPAIVKLWYTLEKAAKEALRTGAKIPTVKGSYFKMVGRHLAFVLPSGRSLYYANAKLEEGAYGGQITYWGVDQTTKRWGKNTTYSGKLAENMCQAISRDCLVQAMLNVDAMGFKIAMHVHDELVVEIPKGKHTVKEINDLMVKKEPWMAGFPLATDGAEVPYYQK